MRKVLIADASEQWRELLEQAMCDSWHVRTSPDGLRTLALAEEFEPDVLVMDLMLSGTDGLSVLKALEGKPNRPRIIVTGRYFSNFITNALERYQVDDMILKPCAVQTITDRVAEVLELEEDEGVQCQDPYDFITALLVSLGAPTSQQGFRFLRTGILLLMENPGQQLTKSLYPAIADQYGTNTVNVEKGLRTTVTTAWLGRRDNVWRSYFPPAPNGQIPKPTAGQFMCRLTDAVLSVNRKRA
ncbi:MAG: response regulator [Ruminococcaceae bacterium]|nr:response regulator [Oscillospiraceae bacterium]